MTLDGYKTYDDPNRYIHTCVRTYVRTGRQPSLKYLLSLRSNESQRLKKLSKSRPWFIRFSCPLSHAYIGGFTSSGKSLTMYDALPTKRKFHFLLPDLLPRTQAPPGMPGSVSCWNESLDINWKKKRNIQITL